MPTLNQFNRGGTISFQFSSKLKSISPNAEQFSRRHLTVIFPTTHCDVNLQFDDDLCNGDLSGDDFIAKEMATECLEKGTVPNPSVKESSEGKWGIGRHGWGEYSK